MGDTIGQVSNTHVQEQYIRLGKKARGQRLGKKKAPKLIIGDTTENTSTSVKATTIKLKPTAIRRGGRIGAIIGRGMQRGDSTVGVTATMGGRHSAQYHR